ncbi:hypothetical protein MGWOODY_Smn3316 [hydrothermal vent metagenome]|uniref:N-acetyltransferase domain-containing protein n=1 Tax=hydrothermal vent metagenome TaxID=652676 RepID=A0A160TEP8_9ZZZZ
MAAAHDWIDRNSAPARTVCIINPENTASLRLAGKLGYCEFDRASYKDRVCVMLARTASTPC